MSGPSLQLGVNAAGKDTLTGLNDQLERLRANLTALKVGKTDLSGISGANEELKKLRIEFAESSQGLKTAFAELAEAIRGGLSKAAEETQKGAAKQRSLVAQERAQLQAEYENAIRDRRQFTQDELQVIRDAGVRLIEADRAMLAARNAANKTNTTALSGGAFRNPNPGSKESEIEAAYAGQARASAAAYEAAKASAWVQAESAAAAEMQRAQDQSLGLWAANEKRISAERVRITKETAAATQAGIVAAEQHAAEQTAARVAAITQAQTLVRQAPVYASRANSAFEAEAQAAAAAKTAAWVKAETAAATQMQQAQDQSLTMWAANERRTSVERLRIAKEAAAAEAAGLAAAHDFAAAESTRIARLQVGSAKTAEAQREAAAKEAEAESTRIARLQVGSAKIAESLREAAATEEAARAAWIAKMQVGSLRIAEEQRLAADREAASILAAAEKLAQAEAAYQLKTQRSQIVAQVRARASLDAGVPNANVVQDFGPTAVSAARAAASVGDLVAKHKQLGEEAASAKPKVASLTGAMGELHSAARGVASGFGAMFLTWGSIAPLLAGAALSNAFVQTVRQGAAVEQTLAVMKELSEESGESINMLRSRLLALAANGPQGPKEIAEAMKALSLAGLDAVSVATSVKQALTLSIIGEMPAKQAAEALVAISTAFGFSAGQFNRVNDVVAKAAAVSMSSVEGMTASFRIASPVAQQYGVNIEDVATQLAVLANIGIRNQQAGTAVTQFYAGLAATTRKGSDALKLLIGDTANLRDAITGNFKPGIEILDMLNAGLAKLKPVAQSDALSAIFNNRAIRDASAALLASRKPSFDEAGKVATDATGKVITEWDKLSKQITESYGFAAIAMANLSLTAENQMKSVMSALHGAFVSTFKELEPEILVFSKQLRDAFNSGDFRTTLSGLANTIGNLAVFISHHTDALKLAAEAWLIYKGAMIGAALLQGAVASFEAIAVALTAVRTASLTAATGFTLVRAAMGPIAFVLSGLVTLWALYKATSETASIGASDVIKLRADQIVESLDKESDRLEKRNQLIRDGISAREADIRVAGQQALAEQDLAGEKQRTGLDKQVAELQAQRAKLQAPVGGFVTGGEDLVGLQIAEAQRGIDIAKVDEKLNALATERVRLAKEEADARGRVKTAVERQVAAAAEAARLNPPDRPKAIPGGTEDFRIPKPFAEANDELSGLRTIFSERMAALKKNFSDEQKIRDTAHTSGVQSDVQYQIETQIAEEESFARRRSLLQQFIADSARALAVLRTDPTKDDKAKAQAQKSQDLLLQQEVELVNEKRLADIKKFGSENKQDEGITKFIAQQMLGLQLQKEQIAIQQSLATLTSDQRAIEEARLAAAGKFTDQIREQQRVLAKAKEFQTSLLALENEPKPDLLGAADAEVQRQQTALDRLRAAQKQAGDFGATNLAAKLEPQWKLLLDGWKNVTEQMKVAYDSVVDTVLSKGEEMWMRLSIEGKLSATAMVEGIRDIVLKQIFQQNIAPALAQMGQGIAGVLFGARPKANPLANPIEASALKTATSLETLNSTGVNPLFGSFQRLIAAAESAASALLNVRGGNLGGGGGGFGDLFGDLFKSGNTPGADGAGGIGNAEGEYPISLLAGPSALGNVFGFAKGGAFTNQVFAQTTPFAFKHGGRFAQGVMAEAGPEAVMPLKRGGDGSLGVAWHGGGGGEKQNVSVVVENHSDGQARVQENKKGDGSREIRVIIDKVKAEVAEDMRRGGQISRSVESQYGLNRAFGLARR